jgi:hypothetical protein
LNKFGIFEVYQEEFCIFEACQEEIGILWACKPKNKKKIPETNQTNPQNQSPNSPHASDDMDLDKALNEAKISIDYFFNNRFEEAHSMLKPYAHCSMYHAVGNSVFSFLEAMLTFEQQHINEALDALKLCLNVCNRYRKKNTITESIGKTFKKINYDQYTELEVHAELCSAEALLLKAMLTFVEDETLSSLIRGGMKIRTCYNIYRECSNILAQRKWENANSKEHFESGVRYGVGTFNLMISLLPGRVIKLLEFIGFSGNKVGFL